MSKSLFIALLFSTVSFSQIGIGTTTPAASAQLDVTSTTKGFLPPRMTYDQKMAIYSPVAGLIIWCLDCGTTGEAQVYNGIAWTNMIGTAASFAKPGAPTNPVGTAGDEQAFISFIAPVSNGGSAITSYTVTSSPGGFTATGASSPLVVTGLSAGTSYTFTVVATNAVGNSPASVASAAVTIPSCGAYVAAGVWKQFMCHNLGADTSLDPNTPVQGMHGNYYQWGRNTVVANASTAAGAISGWNTTDAANGAWTDGTKTVNDPCPTGYRIPTKAQWDGVLNTSLNTLSRTGSWANDGNFTTAISFGTPTVITLTLPAAGARLNTTAGALSLRGTSGYYWSSTEISTNAWFFNFGSSTASTVSGRRVNGFAVRCIKN